MYHDNGSVVTFFFPLFNLSFVVWVRPNYVKSLIISRLFRHFLDFPEEEPLPFGEDGLFDAPLDI